MGHFSEKSGEKVLTSRYKGAIILIEVKPMKINISIDKELLQRADTYAEQNFISRSGLISLALTSYLNAQEARFAFARCANALERIADSGIVDEEMLEELEAVSKAFGMASGKIG